MPRPLTVAISSCMLAALVALGAASSARASPAPSDEEPTTIRIEPAADDSLRAAATKLVAAMSTRERAASVVMGHIPTTDAAALGAYMQTTGIGGFILMGANVPGTEGQLRAVTAALTANPALPPLIAIDQEGGDVSRLPWDEFPSSVQLKSLPPEAAAGAFAARGALVERAGIGVNFGIVADYTSDPRSFIYRRSLGTTAPESAERVAAAVGGEGSFAASTLKHFPGHGAAPGDSHRGIPSTEMPYDQWRAGEALPFEAGIGARAPLVMFGHLAYTAVDPAPASLSAEWHRIVRDELGFDGVNITDDLGMLQNSGMPEYQDPVANAVAAITAGNDMVLAVVSSNAETAPRMVDGIAAAVDAGTLPVERLEAAAVRVAELRLTLAAEGRGLVPCVGCTPAG